MGRYFFVLVAFAVGVHGSEISATAAEEIKALNDDLRSLCWDTYIFKPRSQIENGYCPPSPYWVTTAGDELELIMERYSDLCYYHTTGEWYKEREICEISMAGTTGDITKRFRSGVFEVCKMIHGEQVNYRCRRVESGNSQMHVTYKCFSGSSCAYGVDQHGVVNRHNPGDMTRASGTAIMG